MDVCNIQRGRNKPVWQLKLNGKIKFSGAKLASLHIRVIFKRTDAEMTKQ